jgi:hypothetical protein
MEESMKIRMLEEIKRPFLATKGEVRDVHHSVAIDLTQHGFAEFFDEDEGFAAADAATAPERETPSIGPDDVGSLEDVLSADESKPATAKKSRRK